MNYKKKYLKYKQKYEEYIRNENIEKFKELLRIGYKQTMVSINETINMLNKNNLTLNGGGTIVINDTKDIFMEYLDKGECNFLVNPDKSVYGILLKLNLKQDIELEENMYFYNFNTKNIINKEFKIKNICIKLLVTNFEYSNKNINQYEISNYDETGKTKIKAISNAKNIIKEIVLQTLVSKSTSLYFESSTPYILHNEVKYNNEALIFLRILKEKVNENNIYLNNVLDQLITFLESNNDKGLTIIVMELLEPIDFLLSERNLLLMFYEFVKVLINTRILLIDTNYNNFICTDNENYYQDYDIRFHIIDFGQTELCFDVYDEILTSFNTKKYKEIIYILLDKISVTPFDINYQKLESKYRNLKIFLSSLEEIGYFNEKFEYIINKRKSKIDQLTLNKDIVISNNYLQNINKVWSIDFIINKISDPILLNKIIGSVTRINFNKCNTYINKIKNFFKKYKIPDDIKDNEEIKKISHKLESIINAIEREYNLPLTIQNNLDLISNIQNPINQEIILKETEHNNLDINIMIILIIIILITIISFSINNISYIDKLY
jgi:hypothetical protein